MEYITNNDIFCGWVCQVKSCTNSISGNPRYKVVVGNSRTKKIYTLVTREDEGWVYGINWHNLEGKQIHYTMDIENNFYQTDMGKVIHKGGEGIAWDGNTVTPRYITILDSDDVEEKQEY
jgi:hypothetical protein